MNLGFVDRVIAGAQGALPTVQPRPVSEYEPLATDLPMEDGLFEINEEVVAPRPPTTPTPQTRQTQERPRPAAPDEPQTTRRNSEEPITQTSTTQPEAPRAYEESPRTQGPQAEPEPAANNDRSSEEPVELIEIHEKITTPREPQRIERQPTPPPALIEEHVVERTVREPVTVEAEAAQKAEVRIEDRIREVTKTLREVSRQETTRRVVEIEEETETLVERQISERRTMQERETITPALFERIVEIESRLEQTPGVEVNIGRVEIHAAPPRAPQPSPKPVPAAPRPTRSVLDDFMEKRRNRQ